MGAIEFKGLWWLPGRGSSRKIPGTLRIPENGGAQLELTGSFGSLAGNPAAKAVKCLPIILGVADTGKRITLLESFPTKLSDSAGGFCTVTYAIRTAFVGAHAGPRTPLRFSRMSVEYLYLVDWADLRGLTCSSGPGARYQCAYAEPDRVSLTSEALDGMKVEIRSYCNVEHGVGGVTMREWAGCEMTPRIPMTFDEYSTAIFGVQGLLSLAVARPSHALRVTGTLVGRRTRSDTGAASPSPDRRVTIHFSPVRADRTEENVSALEMLFTLGQVADRIGELVDTWFTKMRDLRPVCDLFSAVQRGTKLYPETRFLFMVQALETYHRRTNSTNVSDRDELDRWVAEVIPSAPPALRKRLKPRLKYIYEPSLRERLQNLLERHDVQVRAFITKPKPFVDSVVTTRNYLTHYDPTSAPSAVTDGADLYNLSQDLKLLLEVCLLDELGFPSADIEAAVLRRLRYGEHKLIPLEEC
jgi:hypothetical protein